MTVAQQQFSDARQALEQDKAALEAERPRWAADLESASAETYTAKGAQTAAEQRFADHQRLVEQLQVELRDVRAQRDKLQGQHGRGHDSPQYQAGKTAERV